MSDPAALRPVRDPVLGEEVLVGATPSGLTVRIAPAPAFRESVAVVAFRYGSTDLGFRLDGTEHHSPEGVAHYLEHKLFEDEELQAFDRFASRGARVNAMTGFARTAYHFSAVDRFDENLADLLHLVGHAHVTPENVDKERGIIEQELRMYEDNPEYRLFFGLLACLFAEHPVRHPVGGTVESIQQITAEELLACYRAFYRTGNAALAVAGPVDPARVLELASRCALPGGPAPEPLTPTDLGPPCSGAVELDLPVARPKVMIGCKERRLIDDPRERQRRTLATRMLLDRLFSASSREREALRQADLVDDSLGANYVAERTFGVAVVSCESDEPEASAAALRQLLLDGPEPDDAWLERARRSYLGGYVRGFGSVRGMAMGHLSEGLEGLDPFTGFELLRSIGIDEVRARHAELFTEDSLAVAIARPAARG